MLCSSIKLTDRREFREDTTPKRNKSTMLEEKLFMKSDYYHSYTFRWDKPKKRHYSCNNPQFLTVNDIIFPDDFSKLNDPPPKQWLRKTPRRKSTDVLPKIVDDVIDDEDGLNISVLTDQLSKETEELIEVIKASVNFEEEDDIDPDIQQLITSTREDVNEDVNQEGPLPAQDDNNNNNNNNNNVNETKKEKRRKKAKNKDKKDEENQEKKERTKTKTRTITFSLSKPPTPQTVQVIRVDVTSNYSFEEEVPETYRTSSSNISDCSKGCGMKILKNKEIKEKLHRKMSAPIELSCNEVNLMCRKLILKDRTDE